MNNDKTPVSQPHDNVVAFPVAQREHLSTCPHCGTLTNVRRFGRLLWAYCDNHRLRWVARDFQQASPGLQSRGQLRRNLEFLSSFVEVSQ